MNCRWKPQILDFVPALRIVQAMMEFDDTTLFAPDPNPEKYSLAKEELMGVILNITRLIWPR